MSLHRLQSVLGQLSALKDLPERMTLLELVRLGADCWEATSQLRTLMETLKDRIRSHVPHTPGQHVLRGSGSVCTVSVPRPQPVVSNNADMVALRRSLGADFDLLFRVQEVVSLKDDFGNTLQRVDPDKQALVLAALNLVDHKPRLSFQKVPS